MLWILSEAGIDEIKSFQFDVNRIMLSGGSAGGNLAAALSNVYGSKIYHQILINPVIECF